jgi:hypothetical protein
MIFRYLEIMYKGVQRVQCFIYCGSEAMPEFVKEASKSGPSLQTTPCVFITGVDIVIFG